MLVQVGPLKIRNPVILASGILGADPVTLKAAYESGAGAVVTKSVTPKPVPSRPKPLIVPYENGWLNAVGLANPGASVFANDLGRPDYPVIVSLAGSTPSDFEYMINLFDGVAGFELNMSCPNAGGFGCDIGDDLNLMSSIVEAAKNATDLPVFVKIGHSMMKSTTSAILAGADGITAINTVPATRVDIETGNFLFGPHRGGLSGPPIRPIALRAVHDLANAHEVPIIGCGGISTWEHAVQFLKAGAIAVQVGSAAMDNPAVLGQIANGLEDWGHREESGQVVGRQARRQRSDSLISCDQIQA
ncbi:MAG: dihydroorotate dehydrogenase [Thaumarchaeota archaeon]|nr:dihydroorotate dehydrogenase [Nitrososphaerota archaeon]MDE0525112.1 dihydroorotate dehydrogenase [Nitrososphaerota archaeon]